MFYAVLYRSLLRLLPSSERIPFHYIFPSSDSEKFTSAPDPFPAGCILKKARLLGYGCHGRRDATIHDLVLHEAIVYEQLRLCPHPNIATYYGCQVVNDRIDALCLKTYKDELHDKAYTMSIADKENCVKETSAAIDHLHSIGYAHNDVNPHNIMLTMTALQY